MFHYFRDLFHYEAAPAAGGSHTGRVRVVLNSGFHLFTSFLPHSYVESYKGYDVVESALFSSFGLDCKIIVGLFQRELINSLNRNNNIHDETSAKEAIEKTKEVRMDEEELTRSILTHTSTQSRLISTFQISFTMHPARADTSPSQRIQHNLPALSAAFHPPGMSV